MTKRMKMALGGAALATISLVVAGCGSSSNSTTTTSAASLPNNASYEQFCPALNTLLDATFDQSTSREVNGQDVHYLADDGSSSKTVDEIVQDIHDEAAALQKIGTPPDAPASFRTWLASYLHDAQALTSSAASTDLGDVYVSNENETVWNYLNPLGDKSSACSF